MSEERKLILIERLTPTEGEIVAVLKDGKGHSKDELKAAIDPSRPDLVATPKLHDHITQIRKKLPPGIEIVCTLSSRRIRYRMIQAILPPEDVETN